jgi:hypothetical protein
MTMASCSFCYSVLSPTTTTNFCCPGCSDPYCSTACLRQNWKTHAPWCGVEYGRKGKDWEIRHISDAKGDGVVALRDFAPLERILVERMIDGELMAQDPAYAAIMRLGPKESSDPVEKYKLNAIGSNDHRGVFGGICVNIAKVNHACEPNAIAHYEPKSNTMVLASIGSIPVGTEVTISYTEFLNPDTVGGKSNEQIHRQVLMKQYGIICNPMCDCYNAHVIRRVEQSRELDRLAQEHMGCGDAYGCLIARLEITIHPLVKRGILFDLFNICNVSGRRAEACEYMKQAQEITSSISHPRSPENRMYLAIAEKSAENTFYQLKEKRTNGVVEKK